MPAVIEARSTSKTGNSRVRGWEQSSDRLNYGNDRKSELPAFRNRPNAVVAKTQPAVEPQCALDDFVAELCKLLKRRSDQRALKGAAASFAEYWSELCRSSAGNLVRVEAVHHLRVDDDMDALFDVLLAAVACYVTGTELSVSVHRATGWAGKLRSRDLVEVTIESSKEFVDRVATEAESTVRYLSASFAQCDQLKETVHRVITLRCQMNGRHELPWYLRSVDA